MSPRPCAAIEPLLVDLADEHLDPDQAHQVMAHIATCPACALLFKDIQRTGRLLTDVWSDHARTLDTLTPERLIAPDDVSVVASRPTLAPHAPQVHGHSRTRGTQLDGWPTSLEVGNSNSVPEFASPTAKTVGHPTGKPEFNGTRALGTLSAAAAVLVAVLLGSFVLPKRADRSDLDRVTGPPSPVAAQAAFDIDQLRRQIEQEGMASRLLAAADELLAVHGGKPYAIDDYRFIANNFAPTTAGQSARKRLTEHNEGAE